MSNKELIKNEKVDAVSEKRKTFAEELDLFLKTGNRQEMLIRSLYMKALRGDVKAFQCIRDTVGEDPKYNRNNIDNKVEIIIREPGDML